MVEPLVLFPFVFDHEIVGISLFKQRCGNNKFALQMLFEEQGGKRFVDTFELRIESAVVEDDLFNDAVAFDVVVAVKKVEVKYFQLFDLSCSFAILHCFQNDGNGDIETVFNHQ